MLLICKDVWSLTKNIWSFSKTSSRHFSKIKNPYVRYPALAATIISIPSTLCGFAEGLSGHYPVRSTRDIVVAEFNFAMFPARNLFQAGGIVCDATAVIYTIPAVAIFAPVAVVSAPSAMLGSIAEIALLGYWFPHQASNSGSSKAIAASYSTASTAVMGRIEPPKSVQGFSLQALSYRLG